MRKNSVKNRRINDEVMKALSEIIRGDLKDPRISPLTSVVAVNVAPDLKTCKAWISVYGDADAGRRTMEGIRSASGFIRGELARRVNLRNTPELTFLFDDSIAYGVAMSKKIDEVAEQDRLAKEQRGEEISE
jgi:ribosome-binding factor A